MGKKYFLILSFVTLIASSTIGFGQAPNLGTASNFALFTANGAFTNVGASVVTGDVGTNVGAFTGLSVATPIPGPGTVFGNIRLPGSTEANQAATDVTTAYNSLNSAACTTILLPELAGQTLTPGVSCQNTANPTTLNGTLVLNGAGVYIIKLSSALTTATSSSISLTNGASFDNVYFQVDGAVDVGINSFFRGTILANGAISLLTGASLEGRGLSVGGAISLSNNLVTIPALSLSVVAGSCVPATNQYSISGIVSLTGALAGTATLTDGLASTTVAVNAGDTSVPFSLTGLTSGTSSHTLTVNYASQTVSVTYTAPASCTVAPASLGGAVFTDTNTNGVQDGGDTPIAGVEVTLLDGASSPVTSTTTSPSGIYSFTGLTPGVPYSVSFTTPTGYLATGSTVTGPVTLTAGQSYTSAGAGFFPVVSPTNPSLSVQTFVDISKAEVGDLLTYSVVLTNSGSTSATTTVRDSLSTGTTYVTGSATVPVGTSFVSGQPISLWTVPFIAAGQSLTLTFQVRVDSTGILYNIITIPGDTVKACTSIPVKLCLGDEYTLTVPAGRASYRWYRDGVLIQGQTSNVLVVTGPGSYSLGVDNVSGLCPDFSCCPFIVEEDTLPAYQTVAIGSTCLGNSPQNNGKLVVSNFNPLHTYQYSLGATFDPTASLSGAPQLIPATGTIATALPNPSVTQFYTVRVYNSSGCYTDVTVFLLPTVCGCPVEVCVPYVITQTQRPKRIGDPIR
ncbi:hypothetical protein GCM10028808_22540 [Spirosoma migulaei]